MVKTCFLFSTRGRGILVLHLLCVDLKFQAKSRQRDGLVPNPGGQNIAHHDLSNPRTIPPGQRAFALGASDDA
jgi:hypothetical protein